MAKLPAILIIEDHPVMRKGLENFFTGTKRWTAYSVPDIDEAKNVLSDTSIEIVLIDIQLKNGWGLDIIPWLKERKGKIPFFAVYTSFDDFGHISVAMSMGVHAYLTKQSREEELEEALLKVLKGETFIEYSVQGRIIDNADIFNLLTRREAEILALVKAGLTNKKIASRLNIKERTVENILYCVYSKTGIKSRLKLQLL